MAAVEVSVVAVVALGAEVEVLEFGPVEEPGRFVLAICSSAFVELEPELRDWQPIEQHAPGLVVLVPASCAVAVHAGSFA